VVRLILLISKGIIRDSRIRRLGMFYSILAAMLMAFVGSTWLEGWFHEHLGAFLLYWAICAWVTVLAALLAGFDWLIARAMLRRHRIEEQNLVGAAPLSDDENAR
jgi:hypothetical protein